MRYFRNKILVVSAFFFFLTVYIQQVSLYNWICVALCGGCYLIAISMILRDWIRPLEQIIEMVQGDKKRDLIPDRSARGFKKNEFTQLALKLHAMHEKMQLQTEQNHQKDLKMEGILNSLDEGVIAFNESAQVTFINKTASQILLCSENKLVGKFLSFIASEMSEETSMLLQKCHVGVLQALQTAEMSRQRFTTKEKCFDLIFSPLMHQEGAMLVIQDKTSDYKVLEVGKNFIANASHELRTPITVLRGFAEMLQNVKSLSPHTIVEIAHKMIRTCDRLNALVKSLLTIADLEHCSSKQFRPNHLLSFFENCKHQLLMTYPHAQVRVSCKQEEISVLADPALLDLALMNLLENGVKYSEDPTRAHLEMSFEARGGEVICMIRDEGIGIPNGDLPYIFDRFYTVDKARQRKSGGVGLGLSIVKTIIEKHGGSICVSSEIGKGTVFTITLRLAENFAII